MHYKKNSIALAETCSSFAAFSHTKISLLTRLQDVLIRPIQSGGRGVKETTAKALKLSHSVELFVEPLPRK